MPERSGSATGAWSAQGVGTIALGGGCYTLGASRSLSGNIELDSNVQIGAIEAAGAAITDNGLIDVQSQPFQARPAVIGNLILQGTISGPGELDVCGSLTWQSGTISGPGANRGSTPSAATGQLVRRPEPEQRELW